jgi:hypothetical protein
MNMSNVGIGEALIARKHRLQRIGNIMHNEQDESDPGELEGESNVQSTQTKSGTNKTARWYTYLSIP